MFKDDYYVGQRVRAIRGPRKHYVPDAIGVLLIGTHGTITGPLIMEPPYYCQKWPVQWDDGRETETDQDWMEPLYDGNSVVGWSECAWQPKSKETV